MPSAEFNRKQVFASACLGMLVFGIVMTVLGTILPLLIERFAVDKAEAGSTFTLLSVGILTGSLVFGPVVDRYGFKGLLIVCTTLVLIGLEALAFAPDFDLLRAAVFVIGFGGGVINGGTNALVSDITVGERSAGLSLLGVFFGIGAFGVPFALGFLMETFSFTVLTGAVGVPVLAAVVYFTTVRFPTPKQPQGFPIAKGAELARDPALLLLGAILFLQSGLEIMTGGWTSTFFEEELAVEPRSAAFALSLFWVGVTVSRLVLGRVLKRSDPARVLRICIGIAIAGSTLMIISQAAWLAYTGIFLTGAGLAAGFPVALGYAGDLYPRMSGTAFSILFVLALTGGSILPLVAGFLGAEYGLRVAFIIIPVALLCMLVLFSLALKRVSGPERPSVSTAP
jgi:fucose permease